MTFQEAQNQINQNKDLHVMGIKNTDPVHMLCAVIVTPLVCDKDTRECIYNEMVDNDKSNEMILKELGLLKEPMGVFVVAKTKGLYYIMSESDYLSSMFFPLKKE